MKHIQVLGSGCASCKTLYNLIDEIAKAKGIAVRLEKVEDIAEILRLGVMSTPGVVVDGQVVHAGGMPERAKIESWLS